MCPLARSFIPPPAAPVVRGWVVVVTGAGGKSWLTNADLPDRETAEHEAARWRGSQAGSGKRYDVCAVMGERL